MSALVVERAPITLKIRDVLRAVAMLRGEIGRPPPPTGTDIAPKTPYFVLTPIDGGLGFIGPPLYSPDVMAEFMFQITYVGDTGVQAEAAADRGRSTLLGRTAGAYTTSLDTTASPPFAAVKVILRESTGAGGMDVDDTLVNLHERYTFGCCLA